MPVDAAPTPNGNLAAFMRAGKLHVRMYRREDVIGQVPRRTSHFSTCPNAKEHRRGGAPKKAAEVLGDGNTNQGEG